MTDRIELEPGRLALRKPELGPLLIVTVERGNSDSGIRYTDGEGCAFALDPSDWLPVLRPGDVVKAGSQLWNIYGGFKQHAGEDIEICSYQSLVFALLRYGPEEDA